MLFTIGMANISLSFAAGFSFIRTFSFVWVLGLLILIFCKPRKIIEVDRVIFCIQIQLVQAALLGGVVN